MTDAVPVAPPAAAAFTQARVERIIGLVTSVGCMFLGVQAFLNALGSDQEAPAWRLGLMVLAFGALALMVVAGVVGRFLRPLAALFAFVFPVVLALWPFATAGRAEHAGGEPWPWYLLNVATAAAILVFRVPLQIVWAVGIPVLYGVVRSAQVDGDASATVTTAQQTVYAIILAGVIVTIGGMLRMLAGDLDRRREEAVRSYAAAAAADAAEQERLSVAALMHDSVLAALIAAERADTPRERTLAVTMAREALTRLANADRDAEEGSDEPVDAGFIVDGIAAAARELGVEPEVARITAADAASIPGRVARALTLAATQAVVNAVQHAAGAGLRAEVRAAGRGVTVTISDAGPGFAPDDVPDDRLGISGSIVARVAAVGGRTDIRSGEDGTTIVLRWEGAA